MLYEYAKPKQFIINKKKWHSQHFGLFIKNYKDKMEKSTSRGYMVYPVNHFQKKTYRSNKNIYKTFQ